MKLKEFIDINESTEIKEKTVEKFIQEMTMKSFNNESQIFDYIRDIESKRIKPDIESQLNWMNNREKTLGKEYYYGKN